MKVSAAILLLALPAVLPPVAARSEERVNFVRDVRPVFEKHCYECHSGAEQESGLRLDVKQAALKGGDNHGPDIVPGKASESPLIHFINAGPDDDTLMPPGEKMSAAEIATLTRWINQGASWPDGVDRVKLKDTRDHWSFKPLTAQTGARSIDQFIVSGLKKHGLKMSAEASPATWLRRVSFDLTGLPPAPAEVRSFQQKLRDVPDNASKEKVYARVVDRLLASPRYGERWGQHWLDVVRYADTHGFEVNTERKNAWPYRDYVIQAFNDDKPYDQFVKEQIAGDATGEDAATGFLITASVLLPGQIGKDAPSKRLARQDSLDEIVNNVSQTFLGLSVGCARCHDHKFDPVTAKDYYAMQAFVAGVEYADREIGGPSAEQRKQQLAPLRKQLQQVNAQLQPIIQSATADANKQKKATSTQTVTNAKNNVSVFEPLDARYVRFTIHAANRHPSLGVIEPCIDEFEIFTSGPEPQNVALASLGVQVTASGSRNSSSHKLKHINDGRYGNERSWMSDTNGRGWVQFKLPKAAQISKIIWSRDRNGKYTDRLPTLFTIQAGLEPGNLKTIAGVPPEGVHLFEQKLKLEARIQDIDKKQLAFAGRFRKPDDIHLLKRGDPEQPTEPVPPAVLSALGDITLNRDTPEQQRRQALADWLADPQNPLTARVMANRIWQGHFGAGLVKTPSDFGNNGVKPTHPQLLDWLTAEFIRSGWSIKHLHRMIVMSQTYRQSGLFSTAEAAVDADASWLWRYPSRRLEAESIRDSMLAVSGQLNLKMYGPGFNLFDKRGGLSGFKPVQTLSPENQRRMIYSHKVRREPEAVFGAFDCPDAGQSTAVRRQSTTPVQALNLFNSSFTMLVSNAFAARIRKEAGDDASTQIVRAYQLAYGRDPVAAELKDAAPVVQEFGLPVLCRALVNSNEFLFIP